jgi:hypothetical protein
MSKENCSKRGRMPQLFPFPGLVTRVRMVQGLLADPSQQRQMASHVPDRVVFAMLAIDR